jgi:hypothetical protein
MLNFCLYELYQFKLINIFFFSKKGFLFFLYWDFKTSFLRAIFLYKLELYSKDNKRIKKIKEYECTSVRKGRKQTNKIKSYLNYIRF